VFPPEGPDLDQVSRAFFSRDGRSVAMMTNGWVQTVDVATGERRFKASLGSPFWVTRACAFAPNGGSLVIVRELRSRHRAGNWFGSSTTSSTVVWLDSQTGSVRREIVIPGAGVSALSFSPDGQAIACGTWSTPPERGTIRIFRLRDKREIQTIDAQDRRIEVLCFTPDGKQIAAGLGDTSIVIWDVRPTDQGR
jgi:WD40 repeat protein